MAITFEDFLLTVPAEHQPFAFKLDEALGALGCTFSAKEAKSGYVISYQWQKKTVMNWVFRKSGMLARIYGDNAGRYEPLIAALPEDMQTKMTSAPDCRRLIDPSVCSKTCVMGMVYDLNGQTYKKCRVNGMFFPLTAKSAAHIQDLVGAEIAARQG